MNNDNAINNESSVRKVLLNDDTMTLHDANIKNGRTLELHMLWKRLRCEDMTNDNVWS